MISHMVSPPAVHDIKRFWKLEVLGITTTQPSRIILRTTKKPVSHSKTVVIWPDYHVSQTIPIAHKLRFSHETNQEHHTATARIPIYSANTVRSSKTKRREGLKNEFHTQKIALNVCIISLSMVYKQNREKHRYASILLCFRMNKFAVSTDIENAFLNVSWDEKDRYFTRFFWIRDPCDPSDPRSPLTTYRFRLVLFGTFVLNTTLLKHLERHNDNWVSEIFKRDLYVDNINTSLPNEVGVLRFFLGTEWRFIAKRTPWYGG